MRKITLNIGFVLFSIIAFGSMIISCSKSNTDTANPGIENGGNNSEVFVEGISFTMLKNGTESNISINEFIGAYINVDELNGFAIKRLEISTGDVDVFPKINTEFPFKIGEYHYGTTYGEDASFIDYLNIDLAEDINYYENTTYSEQIEDVWFQPWVKVISISSKGELTAEFGGTIIKYAYEEDILESIEIKNGIIKVIVEDEYASTVDNSSSLAVPPVIGNGSNIQPYFEIRYPGTYISGTQMLFDTATLTFENKSLNASYFEWELISPSTYLDENYFKETTQVGTTFFSKNMKLSSHLDSSYFYIQLTAYNEQGDSRQTIQRVALPMLKAQMFIDGQRVYSENKLGYLSIDDRFRLGLLGVPWSTTENGFNFGVKGLFPPMGTFLENFHQVLGQYLPPATEREFFAKLDGKSTFSDPDGDFSSLYIDNYSIQIINGDVYKIFGKIYANFTLEGPGGPAHTIELRYLPPWDLVK